MFPETFERGDRQNPNKHANWLLNFELESLRMLDNFPLLIQKIILNWKSDNAIVTKEQTILVHLNLRIIPIFEPKNSK